MGTEHHTEVPATPDDYAHLCALETAARDGGVCVDFEPQRDYQAYLRDMRRRAFAWEGV